MLVFIRRTAARAYDFAYTQGFQSGTNLLVGFNNTRQSTNSPFTSLSPVINPNFTFRLTQHLLQGFGFPANNRFIRIAKNNREVTDVAFRLQMITTVDQIENMYWDLVFFFENVGCSRSRSHCPKRCRILQKRVQIPAVWLTSKLFARRALAADQQSLIRLKGGATAAAAAGDEKCA